MYLPKFVLVIVELIVNAYKMFICFALVVVMMLIYRVPVSWKIVMVIPIFAILFIFVYGCCMIVMHIGVFLDDFAYVVNIGMNMLMYISGLFYSFDKLAAPYGMILQIFNPIAFLMTSMRQVVLYSTSPDYIVMVIWAVISFGVAIFGTQLIYKNENNYVKVI